MGGVRFYSFLIVFFCSVVISSDLLKEKSIVPLMGCTVGVCFQSYLIIFFCSIIVFSDIFKEDSKCLEKSIVIWKFFDGRFIYTFGTVWFGFFIFLGFH